MPDGTSLDTHILRLFGAGQSEVDQLLEYVANPLRLSALPSEIRLPLADEPFASTWREYALQAAQEGCVPTLKKRLIQLNFPIQAGISTTPAYQTAVKTGQLPAEVTSRPGLAFTAPEEIRLVINASPAGTIGAIIAEHRPDFVTLVQALTAKNEPQPVPDSLGAFMVSGYTNWDRIRSYRRQWEEGREAADELAWMLEFQNLRQHKGLYQDRFMLLSNGPYSGIQAHSLDLDPAEWSRQSLTLRLDHECTHYFTRRLFSSMRQNIWDEILADYMGMCAARGFFSADWFLLFLGLEDYPAYRAGGRFEKYIPEYLSARDRAVLQAMTSAAAGHLEDLDQAFGPGPKTSADRSVFLLALCLTGWSGLAAPDYRDRFGRAYNAVSSRIPKESRR